MSPPRGRRPRPGTHAGADLSTPTSPRPSPKRSVRRTSRRHTACAALPRVDPASPRCPPRAHRESLRSPRAVQAEPTSRTSDAVGPARSTWNHSSSSRRTTRHGAPPAPTVARPGRHPLSPQPGPAADRRARPLRHPRQGPGGVRSPANARVRGGTEAESGSGGSRRPSSPTGRPHTPGRRPPVRGIRRAPTPIAGRATPAPPADTCGGSRHATTMVRRGRTAAPSRPDGRTHQPRHIPATPAGVRAVRPEPLSAPTSATREAGPVRDRPLSAS